MYTAGSERGRDTSKGGRGRVPVEGPEGPEAPRFGEERAYSIVRDISRISTGDVVTILGGTGGGPG